MFSFFFFTIGSNKASWLKRVQSAVASSFTYVIVLNGSLVQFILTKDNMPSSLRSIPSGFLYQSYVYLFISGNVYIFPYQHLSFKTNHIVNSSVYSISKWFFCSKWKHFLILSICIFVNPEI